MKTKFTKRDTFLPFSLPTIGEQEIAEVADSLRSGWVTTGPKVERFEAAFIDYIGTRNAVAASSCTAGLHLALAALGVGPGDEVILPTFTFCSTANVVVHLGARPVLVDVGDDGNLLPSAVEAAITERTRALMPVHYGGQPCDLGSVYSTAVYSTAVYSTAMKHGLPVVEDAAHAVGSSYQGMKVGSDALVADFPDLVRVAVFSFYATKNMTTGEGGMLTTTGCELAEKIRILTLHGMNRDAWKRYTSAGSWYYEVVEAGYKYNMTDIQASLGIHQLEKLDGFIHRRQAIAALYDRAFAGMDELRTPILHRDRDHIYHLYPIRLVIDRLSFDRGQFIERLRAYNIGASVHFIPVHLQPFYRERFGYRQGDFPAAERLYQRTVSLPIYPRMSDSDVDYVIQAVQHIIGSV